MLPILILVFVAAFVLVALVASTFGKSDSSRRTKEALANVLKPFKLQRRDETIDVRKNLLFSSIPWLHDVLAKMNLALELRKLLTQADLNWTPGRVLLTSLALWVGGGYLINLRLHTIEGAVIIGAGAGALPILYVLRTRSKRLDRIQEKLPEALDLMVSALRAGHSMSGALGAAAREAPEPLGREFRLCFEEQNFGVDLRSATDNLIYRVPLSDLRIVVTAMLIHKESGGNLAEVLEKTGLVIRDRFRLRQQIKVHTAQGRLTGLVLLLMPVGLAIALSYTNPQYLRLLFTHPLGHRMLIGAGVLNVLGMYTIRRIINIKV